MRRRNAGFTIVELVVLVFIIGIIAAIAIPSLERARKAAQSQSMRQVAIGNDKFDVVAEGYFDKAEYVTSQYSPDYVTTVIRFQDGSVYSIAHHALSVPFPTGTRIMVVRLDHYGKHRVIKAPDAESPH